MNTPKKYVVGLTGGIGSGKSSAADAFHSLGIDIVNADALAREVVEPGQPALAKIAAHFGGDILNEDDTLNRAALRKIVFSDTQQKEWLEKLLHPQIASLLQKRLAAAQSIYAILESPLLLETEQHKLVDRVLAIDVSEDIQLTRAMERDGSDEETIRAIIDSQINREERCQRADDIVSNEGSLEALSESISALHLRYLKLVGEQ